MYKIETSATKKHIKKVIRSMSAEGAGFTGEYSRCAFITKGTGTWIAGEKSNPSYGKRKQVFEINEYKIEMNCPRDKLDKVIDTIREIHPYEEPIINVYELIG